MRIVLILSLLVSLAIESYSQTTVDCSTANIFCSDQSYTFPNQTNTAAPSSFSTNYDYGCVGLTNNPVWYYMEIQTSGVLQLDIAQNTQADGSGTGIDSDFVLWGPYVDQATACTSIAAGDLPIQTGFSISATETIGIGTTGGSYLTNTSCIGVSTPPAASVGDVYVVMITNYTGTAGYVTLNQTSGGGATDCNPTAPCDMTTITTGTTCDLAGDFEVAGSIIFTNPPATGTLTITSTHGGNQVFNAPFSSPTSYAISGLSSDGSAGSVTATFSDDGTCSYTGNYTAPVAINLTGENLNLAGETICDDGSSFVNSVDVTVSGANLTYQWYANVAASNTGGVTTGVLGQSASFTPPSIVGTVYYYCEITSDCGTVVSNVTGAYIVIQFLLSRFLVSLTQQPVEEQMERLA